MGYLPDFDLGLSKHWIDGEWNFIKIITENQGMAAKDMERLISFPLEGRNSTSLWPGFPVVPVLYEALGKLAKEK